jgi:hypothetical protein
MLPLGRWRIRVVALSNCAGFGASAVMMASSALLPIFVQGVMRRSPAIAGLVVGTGSISWMFASFAVGRLMVHTSCRLSAAIGGAALVAGAAVLVTLAPTSGPIVPAAGALLIRVGMGFCNTTFLVAIQASVGWGERGVGTGLQMFMRMLGQSVGAAAFGALLNLGVDRRLPGAGDMVNRMLDPVTRRSLGADTLSSLADAVGPASHAPFIVAFSIAAATSAAILALPARLSLLRPAVPAAD